MHSIPVLGSSYVEWHPTCTRCVVHSRVDLEGIVANSDYPACPEHSSIESDFTFIYYKLDLH